MESNFGTTAGKKDLFSFCLVRDLDLAVTVRIGNLQGKRPRKTFTELLDDPESRYSGPQLDTLSDLYVTCQLFGDNKPLTIPVRTAHKVFKTQWIWNEWLTLPIKYRDLPLCAQLVITVWDTYGPRKTAPVGGTTFRLFGKKNTLKKGSHKLYLWPNIEGDGSVNTLTPGKIKVVTDADRLEKLVNKYKRNDMPRSDWLDTLAFRQIEKVLSSQSEQSNNLYLYIDLPCFDFPLVYSEHEYVIPSSFQNLNSSVHSTNLQLPLPTSSISYNMVIDPEIFRDNPVEAKHRRLIRSHRTGPLDREMKPNAKIRDELNDIMKYPPNHPMTAEEKDLVWKFRFYLTRDKRALTKFLKCVTWSDSTEVKQAVDLLYKWADVNVDDALELLGPQFTNRAVRGYAVSQLRKADDDELILYLLQLVQALKFESISDRSGSSDSPLAQFLIERAIQNPTLGSNFHWYLMVEIEDKTVRKMFGKVSFQFMTAMMETSQGAQRREILRRQGELIASLSKISREIQSMKETRPKKTERLHALISDPKSGLSSFPPLPLPLDATVEVIGIAGEKSSVFKSNLFPLRLHFICEDGSEYPVIFKTGDDLRQDQLVIQIIHLMDRLLRKENLDLKLTPYPVLATGSDHGMVRYIPSMALAQILQENNGRLLPYLKGEKEETNEEVDATVMDNFIKSCAGYCVITYLIGVGDRHLDNLLLSTDGRFFHVDFGYFLGRDPKPFPPAMKIPKEMVDAMGGAQSIHYQRFKSYSFTAFISLRKSANLILNLFNLMVDANIPDIRNEPDKAVTKVQEKFRLDLTEEEAIKHFQNLINESVGAFAGVVFDRIHSVAQYWRS